MFRPVAGGWTSAVGQGHSALQFWMLALRRRLLASNLRRGFLNLHDGSSPVAQRFFPAVATAIPLGNASVDVVVSGLVLNFIPDQPAALAKMARVTGKGGIIGAYVWDYAGKMELMRFFWDAAVKLDPSITQMDETT
jgi:SAM-dependent methyltransferase